MFRLRALTSRGAWTSTDASMFYGQTVLSNIVTDMQLFTVFKISLLEINMRFVLTSEYSSPCLVIFYAKACFCALSWLYRSVSLTKCSTIVAAVLVFFPTSSEHFAIYTCYLSCMVKLFKHFFPKEKVFKLIYKHST